MEKVPHLLARNFKQAEFVRMIWRATVPVGTPIEALKEPAYWSNIASLLQPNARIEVMPEDSAYLVEFIVRSAGPNWAHVEMLRSHVFVSAETVVAGAAKVFDVTWGSPHQKFRVQRMSDKEVLRSGFNTKEEANEWLAANLKALA